MAGSVIKSLEETYVQIPAMLSVQLSISPLVSLPQFPTWNMWIIAYSYFRGIVVLLNALTVWEYWGVETFKYVR